MTSNTPPLPHASIVQIFDRYAPDTVDAASKPRRTKRAAATLLGAALFITAQLNTQPIDTAAPLPPVRAWHGASEALIVAPGDPWSTPLERSDFASTPGYEETRV
ncbi:carboxypeptidase [Xanthomonas fragariae]|uniref:Carboxypeptidase n=1 Tax=Xanthomonas fragariae TaxID=48664 RepID=A0A1Y6HSI7_9XANT|nr:hypothetical protein BER92_17275 [Xanthomonas fragariae]AOD19547.1 hypothetical protein BER93_17330 [Xanthomonas fragariae]SMQ93895.1 carboxypeptidase [Xanthomonas fragariae]SMQ97717.1 hypothetical protein PD885_00448 [Xanthomonas fragariae]SMR04822.1 carboxypeptidase [Xanthomonas fragariae]